MYTLIVTYTSAVPVSAMAAERAAFAAALREVPGFVSKTWLDGGETQGGVYPFADRAAADAFAAGPLLTGLRAAPVVSDLMVRGFAVSPDPALAAG
jgi:hypothetical protein